jgi:hypothetical protein
MNKFIKNLAAPALAIVCAFGMAAPAAFAEDWTTASVIGAQSVTITAPNVSLFEDTFVTGQAQDTTADLDVFSVSDLTGTGAGWAVTVMADQFIGTVNNHELAAGTLLMSEPTVAAEEGNDSPPPSIETGPYTIDNGAVMIAAAVPDEGMGTYDFSDTLLTLSLPSNVYADLYVSYVTFDLIAAP